MKTFVAFSIFTAILVCIVLTIQGFIINTSIETVGYDDKNCYYDEYRSHDEQPRDISNCHKICKDYPIWYKWGHDKDCYWDD